MTTKSQANLKHIMLASAPFFLISLLIFINSMQHMPKVSGALSGLYLFVALIGHFGLIWSLISLLSFLMLKVTKSVVPAALINSMMLVFLFLNFQVYALYRSHLNSAFLEYFFKEAFSVIHMIGLINYIYAALGLVAICALYLVVIWRVRLLQPALSSKLNKVFCWTIFVCFISSQLTYIYVDLVNLTSIKKWTRHIPWYQPLTAKRFLLRRGLIDASNLRAFEMKADQSDSSINYSSALNCETSPAKPNILWIVIDSWRFDEYSAQNTPNIYKWVQEKKPDTFTNHHAVGNVTLPNMFSIFYGIHGIYAKAFGESGTTPTFIDKLQKENYQIQISTSWPMNMTTLPKSAFRKVPNLKLTNGTDVAWKADKIIQKDFFDFLKKRENKDQPFFSFLIFDSVHDSSIPPTYKKPFEPSAGEINYLALTKSTDPTPYFNKHKNAAHYVDSLIKDILNSPYIFEVNRPTHIVVTSDHGDQFNDLSKNYWGHNSNYSKYQIQVPFFVYWDRMKPKAKDSNAHSFDHLTTHTDWSHTFLEEAFNCNVSPQQSVGKNLYSKESRYPLLVSTYSKHGILTEDKIYSYEAGTGYEVFDYEYNELEDKSVPTEIYEFYLKESSRFYQ